MKSVSHIILATLLSSGTAIAQETIEFDRHDTNNDGFLTEQEWNDIDAVESDFDTLDVDEDGLLSEAEVMATRDVELEAEQETGADLERREVAADDHANVQRGRIDRNADEEDPTLSGAASTEADEAAIVATDDTEAEREEGDDREAGNEQAATDVSMEEDEAGFATDEAGNDRDAANEPQMQEAGDEQAGFVTAEEGDAATDDPEPQGGLAMQPSEVAAEDEDAAGDVNEAQSDTEMQNIDTSAARDEGELAGAQTAEEGAQMQDVGERPDPMQQGDLASLSEESLQAFQQVDADSDELISRQEAEDAGFEYVAIHFDDLDQDGNGYLEPREWQPGTDQQQDSDAAPGVRDAAVDQPLYEEQDESGGETGDDTQRDSVAAGTTPVEGEEGAVTFEEDFDTYDINQDGYIDSDEADDNGLLEDGTFERTDINDDGRIDRTEAGTGMEIGDDEEAGEDDGNTGEDS